MKQIISHISCYLIFIIITILVLSLRVEAQSDFETWYLDWTEYHYYYFSRYLKDTKDDMIEFHFSSFYSSLKECEEQVFSLQNEVYTNRDGALQIQITKYC